MRNAVARAKRGGLEGVEKTGIRAVGMQPNRT
jgi:hypothetical protein